MPESSKCFWIKQMIGHQENKRLVHIRLCLQHRHPVPPFPFFIINPVNRNIHLRIGSKRAFNIIGPITGYNHKFGNPGPFGRQNSPFEQFHAGHFDQRLG